MHRVYLPSPAISVVTATNGAFMLCPITAVIACDGAVMCRLRSHLVSSSDDTRAAFCI